jgi:serine/threonine-protein kinase RsbW
VKGKVRSHEPRDDEIGLVLNNTIDAVEEGRRNLFAFYTAHVLPARTINHLEIIFEEIVSNVVRHGFTAGSDQSIRVLCRVRAEEVELVVEDDGRPFDPLAASPPPKFESVETARLGGLGIPLITKLASSVRYDGTPGWTGSRRGATQVFEPVNRLTVTVAIVA